MSLSKDIKAIISNDRSRIPITIKVTKFKSFEKRGVKKDFIANLVISENNDYGVFRNNYFMITTSKPIRAAKDSESLRAFSAIMEKCYLRGFDYVMIKL